MERVSLVRVPSGAQRKRQLPTVNNALQAWTEQRKSLHTPQGAMKPVAWPPAERTSRMPDFPAAYHNPRDEGTLRPFQSSRPSFVVVVDWEGHERWIVDRLQLLSAHHLEDTFRRQGFIMHSAEKARTDKVTQ